MDLLSWPFYYRAFRRRILEDNFTEIEFDNEAKNAVRREEKECQELTWEVYL